MFSPSTNIPDALMAELKATTQTIATAIVSTPAFQAYDLPLAAKYLAVALAMETTAGNLRQTARTLGEQKHDG